MTDLRMSSYYYSFQPTGCIHIDQILSAVAVAGKRFHHTEYWEDTDEGVPSCIDEIQKAANEAAQAFAHPPAAQAEDEAP